MSADQVQLAHHRRGGAGPDRVQAPFARRNVPLSAVERRGAYTVLVAQDTTGPRPQAGQFYMLSSSARWGGGEAERPFLPRAFSVLRAGGDRPEPPDLQFLLEAVGPGTARLCELAAGEELTLLGPLGIGFAPPREGRRPLLVGGGVGIAPLAILQDQLGAPAPALLGFRDAARAQGAELLTETVVATEDGSAGYHGLVTDLLLSALREEPDWEVYACGPPAMLESVRELCAGSAVPAQLALEAGMACGFGACFGCVVPTRTGYLRLCVDGPVIDAGRLARVIAAGAGH